MLLFYHSTYDTVYFVLELGACIFRFKVNEFKTPFDWVSIICLMVWVFIELPRLNFGYRGNINELFPEMAAFLIFTSFFSLPMSIGMIPGPGKFPHELCTCLINVAFLIVEVIAGIVVLCLQRNARAASFFLRTAPQIDPKFKKKYANATDIYAEREI